MTRRSIGAKWEWSFVKGGTIELQIYAINGAVMDELVKTRILSEGEC